MNLRPLLFILIIVAVVVLAIRLTRHPREKESQNPDGKVVQAPTPVPSGAPAKPLKPISSNTNDTSWALQTLPPGSNLQEQLEELARRRGVSLSVLTQQALGVLSNALSDVLNGPIEFYGKVVDEDDTPLQGAVARIRCVIFPEEQSLTNISTDAKGVFAVQGVSGQALLASITKDGYEEVPGTNKREFIYYGAAVPFMADSNNPVPFYLRRKSPTQK